jgi:hypothetical protein
MLRLASSGNLSFEDGPVLRIEFEQIMRASRSTLREPAHRSKRGAKPDASERLMIES